MAAAKNIRVDAAIAAVLSGPDGIVTLKEQRGTVLKVLLCATTLFYFTPDWLLARVPLDTAAHRS